MAKYFLEHLPGSVHPCLLLFEINGGGAFNLQWMEHPREINEFDLTSAKLVFQFPPEPSSRLRQLHDRTAVLVSVTLHYLNTGMLSNLLFRPELRTDEYGSEIQDDHRGLYNPPSTAFTRSAVAEAIQHRPPAPRGEDRPISRGTVLILEDVHASRPQDQLRLVAFVLPTLNDLYVDGNYPTSIQTSFGEVPIINLARPDIYPQFYSQDLWFDKLHLNAEGARLVTAELASQIRAWYSLHPPAEIQGCKS